MTTAAFLRWRILRMTFRLNFRFSSPRRHTQPRTGHNRRHQARYRHNASHNQLNRIETDNTVADSTSTGDDEERDEPEPRSPMLSFSNTDIAFRDDIMVAGSYHGFNIYQLDESGVPELTASVVCPGGQGDVSIVDHLLIMSVEETRGRVDCGLQASEQK